MVDSALTCPPGYSTKHLFARGNSEFFYRKPQSNRVMKYPPSDVFEDLTNELDIYTRLTEGGCCNRIAQCHGKVGRGIELEYLSGGCLTSVLEDLPYRNESLRQRLRWASQYAEAIKHIHSKNVQDAGVMGKIPIRRFCHAGHLCPPLNGKIQSDIFQSGVALYHIMTSNLPYRSDDHPIWKEIKDRYDKGQFTPASSLPVLGDIVAQCWECKYQCVEAIENDIKHLNAQHEQHIALQPRLAVTRDGVYRACCWSHNCLEFFEKKEMRLAAFLQDAVAFVLK